MELSTRMSSNMDHSLQSPEPSIAASIDEQATDNAKDSAIKKPSKKRAHYWNAYKEYKDEMNKRRARCIFCGSTYACDSRKNGNKNLGTHFEKNPANVGKVKGKQPQITMDSFGDNGVKMKNWTFDAQSVREAVVQMVIIDELPFHCVEKNGLKRAFFAACLQFKMPSRTTIQRDCWKLYIAEREKIRDIFRNSCQRVSITTDSWTSSNNENFMCVTAHFVDNDWNLQKRIINFCKVTSHRGHDIGKLVEDCLNYWDLGSKLLTVTVDNASSNDVACAYLSTLAKEKGSITEGNYLQVRCMAHILNLIVQDGIKKCGDHVAKLRALVKYVRSSPVREKSFRQLAEKLKVSWGKSLALDVCTRWNSTYDMISSALPYKVVFSRMELLRDSDLVLLTSSDWEKIEVLGTYLKEFYA